MKKLRDMYHGGIGVALDYRKELKWGQKALFLREWQETLREWFFHFAEKVL